MSYMILTIKKRLSFSASFLLLFLLVAIFPHLQLIKYVDSTKHMVFFHINEDNNTQTSITSQSSVSELTLFLVGFFVCSFCF